MFVHTMPLLLALLGPGMPMPPAEQPQAAPAEVAPGLLPDRLVVPTGTIQAGAGVTAFSGHAMGQTVNTGGLWDVRGVFGSGGYLGAEAGYVGTSSSITALGLDTDNQASLVSTSLEAAVRVNIPMNVRNVLVQPFGFGGAGWTRFDLANHKVNTSSLKNEDNVLTIPFGGGIALGYERFVFDARYTYRAAFDEGLARTATGEAASLGTWSLAALIGYKL